MQTRPRGAMTRHQEMRKEQKRGGLHRDGAEMGLSRGSAGISGRISGAGLSRCNPASFILVLLLILGAPGSEMHARPIGIAHVAAQGAKSGTVAHSSMPETPGKGATAQANAEASRLQRVYGPPDQAERESLSKHGESAWDPNGTALTGQQRHTLQASATRPAHHPSSPPRAWPPALRQEHVAPRFGAEDNFAKSQAARAEGYSLLKRFENLLKSEYSESNIAQTLAAHAKGAAVSGPPGVSALPGFPQEGPPAVGAGATGRLAASRKPSPPGGGSSATLRVHEAPADAPRGNSGPALFAGQLLPNTTSGMVSQKHKSSQSSPAYEQAPPAMAMQTDHRRYHRPPPAASVVPAAKAQERSRNTTAGPDTARKENPPHTEKPPPASRTVAKAPTMPAAALSPDKAIASSRQAGPAHVPFVPASLVGKLAQAPPPLSIPVERGAHGSPVQATSGDAAARLIPPPAWPLSASIYPPPGPSAAEMQTKDAEPEFSHASVTGDGFRVARLQQRTCFTVAAMDKQLQPLDKGHLQRAFFTARLTLVQDWSAAGTPMVYQAVPVEYVPESSTHRGCFAIGVMGQYRMEIFLEFTNAWKVKQRLDMKNAAGYTRHVVVARSSVTVFGNKDGPNPPAAPPATSAGYRTPVCGLGMLTANGNEGYWSGLRWVPHGCELRPLDTRGMLAQFDGKRVLLMGDSQMRFVFAVFRALLQYRTAAVFEKRYQGQPGWAPRLLLHKPQLHSGPPFIPGSGTVWCSTQKDRAGTLRFYGNQWEGLGVYEVKTRLSKFIVSYLPQFGARHKVLHKWMEDVNATDWDTRLREGIRRPFDLVLAEVGLHDMKHFHNASDFAKAFKASFLPSVGELVRDLKDVIFFGPWAAHEETKPARFLHASNNVRGLQFEDLEVQALKEAGFPHFISTKHMTLARPDLCTDSTHYSWPIPYSMLNLVAQSLRSSASAIP